MKMKSLILFGISVAFFGVAATYKFYDSSHVIGVVKKGGGQARHPALLEEGRKSATLIVTAKVLPPYRGNARIVLEGMPGTDYTVYDSEPGVRIPVYRRPFFEGNILHDLQPSDRIALWVVMKNQDGLTGKANKVSESREQPDQAAPPCPQHSPSSAGGNRWANQRPQEKGPLLSFYDTMTNEPLLRIPIRFIGKGGDKHGEQRL